MTAIVPVASTPAHESAVQPVTSFGTDPGAVTPPSAVLGAYCIWSTANVSPVPSVSASASMTSKPNVNGSRVTS